MKPETILCRRCRERSPLAGRNLCWACLEYERLLREDVTACPAYLGQDDFERFMHKLSIHAHANRPPKARHLKLVHMELHLKEEVLKKLPLYYVSMLQYGNADQVKTGAHGSYTFKTKLPQEVLFRTVEQMGLWRPYDPDEGTREFS